LLLFSSFKFCFFALFFVCVQLVSLRSLSGSDVVGGAAGNYVTMHLLNCLYTQAMLTKGRLPPPAPRTAAGTAAGVEQQQQGAAGGFGTGAFGAGNSGGYGNRGAAGGAGGQQAGGWGSGAFGGGVGGGGNRVAASAAAPGGGAAGPKDDLRAAIQVVFRNAADAGSIGEGGMSCEEVMEGLRRMGWNSLSGNGDLVKIRQTCSQLAFDGILFEGGDDNHFNTTGQ
jgi:hypothetical protein